MLENVFPLFAHVNTACRVFTGKWKSLQWELRWENNTRSCGETPVGRKYSNYFVLGALLKSATEKEAFTRNKVYSHCWKFWLYWFRVQLRLCLVNVLQTHPLWVLHYCLMCRLTISGGHCCLQVAPGHLTAEDVQLVSGLGLRREWQAAFERPGCQGSHPWKLLPELLIGGPGVLAEEEEIFNERASRKGKALWEHWCM